MKKIFVVALSLAMLASVVMAGSRTTILGQKILDLGECTEENSNCVVAEVVHPKYGHLMQFVDVDRDGIPDYAYMFQASRDVMTGRKGLIKKGKIRQSPQGALDVINDICAQHGVAEDTCVQYSDLFTGWEKIEGE